MVQDRLRSGHNSFAVAGLSLARGSPLLQKRRETRHRMSQIPESQARESLPPPGRGLPSPSLYSCSFLKSLRGLQGLLGPPRPPSAPGPNPPFVLSAPVQPSPEAVGQDLSLLLPSARMPLNLFGVTPYGEDSGTLKTFNPQSSLASPNTRCFSASSPSSPRHLPGPH